MVKAVRNGAMLARNALVAQGIVTLTWNQETLVEAGLQPERGVMAVLGAPGGAGAAHIVQFWPVRVEGARDEFAPEAADVVRDPGSVFAVCRRSGQGG